MCGLAGVVDFAVPSVAHEARVSAMRRRLRHRGPDGEGAFVGPNVCLGHTRLAIVDVAGGAQPMSSPDGRYTVVYNGELANGDELRAALDDGTLVTRSDTELVLRAFLRWGDGCVSRLSGMFAFFVWDAERRRGFAARDRLGVKPFVYAREGSAFVFASEAQAIVATAAAAPRADLEAVTDVLLVPCFSGVARTMFAGVLPLPAGHSLVVDASGVHVRRYWDWPARADRPLVDDRAAVVSALREVIPPAVHRALASDVPVGIFASGGLD